jgi:hypothetical protein
VLIRVLSGEQGSVREPSSRFVLVRGVSAGGGASWTADRLEDRESLLYWRKGRERLMWFRLVPVTHGVEVV